MNHSVPSFISEAKYLLIDSRKLISPQHTAFFAIKGLHLNGHDFIEQLYKEGVRAFVVSEVPLPKLADAKFWQVADTVEALQFASAMHRAQFHIPVIGITGSNAKTIIKEWLFQLLEGSFHIVKSPKSYNSQVGVPLSVWEMNHRHDLGIFEAGISKVGEMEKLAAILKPSIGLFTNIGSAHQDGFVDLRQKVIEKLQLFQDSQVLIYCIDHAAIHEEIKRQQLPSFTWGADSTADICLLHKSIEGEFTNMALQHKGEVSQWELPFTDSASVENCLHCIAIGLYLQLPQQILQQRLHKLQNISMRLALKEGNKHCLLIDDTYNNDVAGLTVALDFMAQQDSQLPRMAILSDFLEADSHSLPTRYQEVGRQLLAKDIQEVWGVGPEWAMQQEAFPIPLKCFPDTQALLEALPQIAPVERAVLIKGARTFALEQLVGALQRQLHGTRLEIDLDALAHNFRFYKSLVLPTTKIMVMVKALAYGNGGYEVASLLQYHHADYLAVAYTDEGLALRERGIRLPIMVMNPAIDGFEKMAQYHLEPELYSLRVLKAFIAAIPSMKKVPPIHLKVNTGMNRLGFDKEDLPLLIQLLQKYPQLTIASVFTHLAGADEAMHEEFTGKQLALYDQICEQLEEVVRNPFIKHALNSPGITRFPQAQYDMVRLGIGLYGVDVNDFYQERIRTVGTLKTHISQIRKVKAGETIGYGRKGIMPHDGIIGVIAIGYADGFDRRLSNGVGKVLVQGQLVPVIGNVCMDMSMVNLTAVPEVQEGDEAIVFGSSPSIQSLANDIGTIPYEILTNVGQRVKRVFYTA